MLGKLLVQGLLLPVVLFMGSLEPIDFSDYEEEPDRIVINIVGDICVGTPYGSRNKGHTYYEKEGPQYFLDNVRGIFEADDFTIANLENVFTDSEKYLPGKIYSYKAYTKYFDIISNSSIDIMGVMNNHSQDYYQRGLDDTIELLEYNGTVPIGFNDYDSFSYPELGGVVMDRNYIMEANGVKVGIAAYLGFRGIYANRAKVEKDIKNMKDRGAEYIIIYPHWGVNNQTTPRDTEVNHAKMYIDLGADLVVGHHAHILQPMETYKGKRIYYNMGDFMFFHRNSRVDNLTFILNIELERQEDGTLLERFNHIPIQWTGSTTTNVYQPYVLKGEVSAERLSKRIKVPLYEVTTDAYHYNKSDKLEISENKRLYYEKKIRGYLKSMLNTR